MTPDQLHALAIELADAAVIADIDSDCCRVWGGDHYWWDTRIMLDEREAPAEFTDMAEQALQYAEARGLITRHAVHPFLVRINPT
jgi:hypothetical protein